DLNLVLTHSDGLDHDHVEAAHVEDVRGCERSASQTSGGAAGGHAAYEDAWIEHQLAHADAIAENSAAGERAGGVDCDDRNPSIVPPDLLHQLAHQGGFAAAWHPGDADDVRPAGGLVRLR